MQKLSRKSRLLPLLIPVAIALFGIREAGCQFTFSGNPDVSLVTVHVSPIAATVDTGGKLNLTATITGYKQAGTVSWSVVGSTSGKIISNGLSATFIADTALTVFPTTVRVRATSDEDPSRYVECVVTIAYPVDTGFSASPRSVTMLTGETQQFALDTVTSESSVPNVQWQLISGPGSITAGGLYTAPATLDHDSTFAVVRAVAANDESNYSQARILLLMSSDSFKCYSRDIQAVLSGSCGMSNCHDAASHKGGYNYNTYAGTVASVRKGDARASRLYTAITQLDMNNRMPPPPQPTLTPGQILTIGQWINEGAPDCQ